MNYYQINKKYPLLNIFFLISKNQKILFFLFIIFSFTLMILEIFSLSSLIPLLSYLTGDDLFQNSKFSEIYQFIFNKNNLSLNFILFLVFFLFFVKNLFIIAFVFFQKKLTTDISINFTEKLSNIYMNRDYEDFIKKNSSYYIRTLSVAIDSTASILDSCLLIIVESLLIIGVVVLLCFAVDIRALIVVMSLIIPITVIYYLIKNYMKKSGKKITQASEIYIKKIQEVFVLFKYLKIYGEGNEYLKEANRFMSTQKIKERNLTVVKNIPRLILEIMVVSIIVLYFYYMNKQNQIEFSVSTAGIFFIAAIRLLPSFTKILFAFNSLQKINYSALMVLDDLNSGREILKKNDDILNSLNYDDGDIIAKNISFSYNKDENKVINNLSFTIKKNKINFLVGKSGSGKSTLIDIILGFLKLEDGEFYIDNKKINFFKNESWIKKISFVPQKIYFPNDNIYNILKGISPESDFKKNYITLKKDGYLDFLPDNPEELKNNKMIDFSLNYSGGQIQRIAIAKALLKNSKLIIFDEAFSGLDFENKKILQEIIKKASKKSTILMSTHDQIDIDENDLIIKL